MSKINLIGSMLSTICEHFIEISYKDGEFKLFKLEKGVEFVTLDVNVLLEEIKKECKEKVKRKKC